MCLLVPVTWVRDTWLNLSNYTCLYRAQLKVFESLNCLDCKFENMGSNTKSDGSLVSFAGHLVLPHAICESLLASFGCQWLSMHHWRESSGGQPVVGKRMWCRWRALRISRSQTQWTMSLQTVLPNQNLDCKSDVTRHWHTNACRLRWIWGGQ